MRARVLCFLTLAFALSSVGAIRAADRASREELYQVCTLDALMADDRALMDALMAADRAYLDGALMV